MQVVRVQVFDDSVDRVSAYLDGSSPRRRERKEERDTQRDHHGQARGDKRRAKAARVLITRVFTMSAKPVTITRTA
jgi:hypothetical protein